MRMTPCPWCGAMLVHPDTDDQRLIDHYQTRHPRRWRRLVETGQGAPTPQAGV